MDAKENYPFESASENLRYFTFLDQAPSLENLKVLESKDYSPEQYKIDNKVVYLFPVNGFGKANLNNNVIESKLKAQGTTRNWKTVCKLIELSK